MSRRPATPDDYHSLDFDKQVAHHHIAVLRWEEANPEIVKAEEQAERREKKLAAKRAERLAFEADIEAGRKMTAPPPRPKGPNRHDDPIAQDWGQSRTRCAL